LFGLEIDTSQRTTVKSVKKNQILNFICAIGCINVLRVWIGMCLAKNSGCVLIKRKRTLWVCFMCVVWCLISSVGMKERGRRIGKWVNQ
jgi:hypothetical protein